MPQQTLAIVVDAPQDELTAVESAAAAAVESIQSAGVVVIAATFGGQSLLPTPEEALRSAIDDLTTLASKGTPPKPAELQAAVERVDKAAAVVEAANAPADPSAAPAAPGGVALPVEPPAPAAAPAELTGQPVA